MAPFFPCLHLLFFFFFFSHFILPPLSIFTSFFHLHFLHLPTISSLENHFPKLLNLPSFISLNIFSDLFILDHLCNKPIFKPSVFAFSMESYKGPSFLTFNGKKYHPFLEWNEEEGLLQEPKIHAPHFKKDFKVSSFFFLFSFFFFFFGFFVGNFVESLMLRHCHFVVVCSCWNFEHCMIWLETLV